MRDRRAGDPLGHNDQSAGRAASLVPLYLARPDRNEQDAPPRDPDVAAILDRCDAIEFEPTKTEILRRMREIFPDDNALIDLLAELPALPSLRTLVKARNWQKSKHLNLIQELLDECGVPEPVTQLAQIMESVPESQWCQRYVATTGLTDRTYRRHKSLARQLLDCRGSANRCPDVRTFPSESAPRSWGVHEEDGQLFQGQ